MTQASSHQQIAQATLWTLLEFVVERTFTVVTIAILARLLAPEDFGTYALLAIFLGIATALTEGGFGLALIQDQDTNDVDHSTVFWISFATATVFACSLFLAAPLIASLFEIQTLEPIARIIAAIVWISGLGIVQRALMIKRLAFKRLAAIKITATFISGLVAILLALSEFGVFSLAWHGVAAALVTTALLWICASWTPNLVFNLASAKRLFSFGGYMLASTLLEVTYSKAYTLFIGKIYGAAELGQFHNAQTTVQMASGLVVTPVSKIAFPAFSRMNGNLERIRIGLQEALRVSMLFNSAAMLTLAVVAQPFVLTLLGPQWELAAQLLPLLALVALLMPLHVLNLQALMAIGRSDLFLLLEIVKKSIGIAILVFSVRYGVFGVAWALLVSSVISFFINAWYARQLLGLGPIKQLLHILQSIAIGIVVASAAYASLTLSGLQSPIFQLLVSVFAAVGTLTAILGGALLLGHDLSGLRQKTVP